ncbi:hypothetical protein R1flu_016425 [Riccia fluitans]|uniref:Uncharacterized protein n=1 Tax=Riccia fluitans TaxID=41844 RepID=A0ABD1YMU2_9MARC
MYENLTQILIETVYLENRMGLTYIDLILEASARLKNNEERVNGFLEEVKKLSGLTKDALASLADVKDLQKTNEKRIAELIEEKATAAVLEGTLRQANRWLNCKLPKKPTRKQ